MSNKTQEEWKEFKDKYVQGNLDRGLCRSCPNPVVSGRKSCRKHLDYFLLRVRRKRKEARGSGRCHSCTVGIPETGKVTCAVCLGRHKAWLIKQQSVISPTVSRCSQCTRPRVPGKSRCVTCLERARVNMRNRRSRLREFGCSHHPGVKLPCKLCSLVAKQRWVDRVEHLECPTCQARLSWLSKHKICKKCRVRKSKTRKEREKRNGQAEVRTASR